MLKNTTFNDLQKILYKEELITLEDNDFVSIEIYIDGQIFVRGFIGYSGKQEDYQGSYAVNKQDIEELYNSLIDAANNIKCYLPTIDDAYRSITLIYNNHIKESFSTDASFYKKDIDIMQLIKNFIDNKCNRIVGKSRGQLVEDRMMKLDAVEAKEFRRQFELNSTHPKIEENDMKGE